MPSSNPIASVVIPTRGRPALLLRAIRSALEQSLQEIEVIVVIDGEEGSESADGVARLRDHRVRCIALDERVGGAEARNIGARSAQSPWVALLDDDDEWLPAKLEAQIDAAVSQTSGKQPVVTCQHIHRAEGAADVIRPRRLPQMGEVPREFMFDYLCYFQTSTFVCPRQLMLKVPFTKGLPFFHDIDWFLRVMGEPDVELVVVPQPLSIYYAPEKRPSITSSFNWKDKVEWGRARRELMGKRSYSRFIVGSCAGPAVQDRAGLRGLSRLLYECAVVGSPTPQLLLMLCGTYLLRPGLRKRLRDRFLLRRADVQIRPDARPAL